MRLIQLKIKDNIDLLFDELSDWTSEEDFDKLLKKYHVWYDTIGTYAPERGKKLVWKSSKYKDLDTGLKSEQVLYKVRSK